MALKLSRRAKELLLGSKYFTNLMATPYIKIFSGTAPLYPEMAVDSGQVLATIPVAWDATPVVVAGSYDVYLVNTTPVWTDTSADATGYASFFRIYDSAVGTGITDDTPLGSAFTLCRIQGTVGDSPGFDLVVADAYYVIATSKTINSFKLRIF